MSYPMAYALALLRHLQSKQMYQGTVDPEKVDKTRKANKLARKQRRVNRLRGA